ncbi:hypothetical protein [Victivallis sp. Marseille-Q1083]|uniref:hypothetical protein n=1 Tax=Victivallis sp. Marseille-Q1083 TaxID=2717288 RepID=UPI00158BE066|nr:hypothetical protein [Victivallis sp. Marseille-Q1083]
MSDESWAELFRRNMELKYQAYFSWLKFLISLSGILLTLLVSLPQPSAIPAVRILSALSAGSLLTAVLSGVAALYGEVQVFDTACRAALEGWANRSCPNREIARPAIQPRYQTFSRIALAAFALGVVLSAASGITWALSAPVHP